jgi:phage pi2 protein 07
MNNTLTAKEWLEKGFAPIKNLIADERGLIQQKYFENCMERYASYRTKKLEKKIMEFRERIKNDMEVDDGGWVYMHCEISGNDLYPYHDLIDVFDKHFNITSETKEK